jgi:hypothetical protein
MGGKLFKSSYIQKWQHAAWGNAIHTDKAKPSGANNFYQTPIEAVLYALSLLGADEWLTPRELSPLLKMFCPPDIADPDAICQAGYDCGCLLKLSEAGMDYYRLPDERSAGLNMEPGCYLPADSRQTVAINLQLIPLQNLEFLAQIATLKVDGRQLRVSPNLVRMGRAMPSLPNHPLVEWLQEQSPLFKEAVKSIAQRWGKQILHQDLLIAKIKDLSLKVLIRNSITDPEQLLFLSDDFVAFPANLAATIEKLVNKAGHVIKWVNAT